MPTNLVRCVGDVVSDSFELVVDQEKVDFLGIDSKYLGATVRVDTQFTDTVYLEPVQLAHR